MTHEDANRNILLQQILELLSLETTTNRELLVLTEITSRAYVRKESDSERSDVARRERTELGQDEVENVLGVAVDGAALCTEVDPAHTASTNQTDLRQDARRRGREGEHERNTYLGGLDGPALRLIAALVLHNIVNALQELHIPGGSEVRGEDKAWSWQRGRRWKKPWERHGQQRAAWDNILECNPRIKGGQGK